jgi:hypothetical protein
MAKKKRTFGGQLGKREKQFLHLKEFSQGKPNEISLNVLEQLSEEQDEGSSRSSWRLFRFREDAKEVSSSQSKSEHASSLRKTESSVPTSNAELSGSNEMKPAKKKPLAKKHAEKLKPSAEKHAGKKGKRAHAAPKVSTPEQVKPQFLGPESQAEILKRQRRRRKARRAAVAAVVALCLAAAAVAGYFAYKNYERLSTSIGVLREACGLIEQSDETTVALDSYFQTSFNDGTIQTAQDLSDKIPAAKEKLEDARIYAEKAKDELEGSQRDKEAAERTLNAISSRKQLLELSSQRIELDIPAKKAIDAMNEAWAHIQEGNALLLKAANVISDTTNENVAKSTEYTTASQLQFTQATQCIETAKSYYSSVDYSTATSYIEKRQQAASEALLSNAAILIQDKATAESHNDAYNQADQEAVALAEQLPKNFAQPVIDAYSTASAQVTQQYDNLRSTAASNDAYLREYLNEN